MNASMRSLPVGFSSCIFLIIISLVNYFKSKKEEAAVGGKKEHNPTIVFLLGGSGNKSRFAEMGRVFDGFAPFLRAQGSSTHRDAGPWTGEGSGVNKQSSCKSGLKCINGNHRTACERTFSRHKRCRGLKKD